MKRSLVIGGGGQDGYYLVKHLADAGEEVVVGIRPGRNLDRWPDRQSSTVTTEIDVCDLSSVARALETFTPDTIYHLAGFSSVGESWRLPYEAITTNALGTLNVVEAIRLGRRHSPETRLVHASSGEVFAGMGNIQCDEDTSMNPVSPYGQGKAMARRTIEHYRKRFGVDARIAILFSHESPLRTPHFLSRTISDQVARIYLGGHEPVRLGNLKAERDWGFAGDYARAMAMIATHREPDDYVVATGATYSVADWVCSAFQQIGINDWRQYVLEDSGLHRPVDPVRLVGNPSKIEDRLGWSRSLDFEQLVSVMLRASIERLAPRSEKIML